MLTQFSIAFFYSSPSTTLELKQQLLLSLYQLALLQQREQLASYSISQQQRISSQLVSSSQQSSYWLSLLSHQFTVLPTRVASSSLEQLYSTTSNELQQSQLVVESYSSRGRQTETSKSVTKANNATVQIMQTLRIYYSHTIHSESHESLGVLCCFRSCRECNACLWLFQFFTMTMMSHLSELLRTHDRHNQKTCFSKELDPLVVHVPVALFTTVL